MAFKTKTGIILRNPAETGKRYARQLKNGKVAETGKSLTKEDKAFRKGYLTARSDSAKAYCHNKGIKSKRKTFKRKRRTGKKK